MSKPSLIQELETAMILQQLGQQAVYAEPANNPARTAINIDRRSRNLKRKLSEPLVGPNAAPLFPNAARAACQLSPLTSPKFLRRSVSPGTDLDSISELSSCASFTTENDNCVGAGTSMNTTIRPLEAPPKLRKIPSNPLLPPFGIQVTKYRSQQNQQITRTGTAPQFNIGSTSTSSRILPRMQPQRPTEPPRLPMNAFAPNFTNNMIVQLMSKSNRMVMRGQAQAQAQAQNYPLCQVTGTVHEPNVDFYRSSIAPTPKPQSPPSVSSDSNPKEVKECRMDGCDTEAARRTPYCKKHCGQRRCEFSGCAKCAQGRTRFCIGHGGGRRCQFEGCAKGARDKQFCASHGGGKRCNVDSCSKLAIGRGKTCTAHGGGRRCQHESCAKSAQSSSNFCVRHGGGRKCTEANCSKVARGKKGLCMSHASQHEASLQC